MNFSFANSALYSFATINLSQESWNWRVILGTTRSSFWLFFCYREGLPDGSVVKIPCFHCRGVGLILGQGSKIQPCGVAKKKNICIVCVCLCVCVCVCVSWIGETWEYERITGMKGTNALNWIIPSLFLSYRTSKQISTSLLTHKLFLDPKKPPAGDTSSVVGSPQHILVHTDLDNWNLEAQGPPGGAV